MHRTTILLPEDLQRDSEAAARRMGITLSELIRRSLRGGLSGASDETAPAATSRFFRRKPWPGDSPRDLSEHHDAYLYDS